MIYVITMTYEYDISEHCNLCSTLIMARKNPHEVRAINIRVPIAVAEQLDAEAQAAQRNAPWVSFADVVRGVLVRGLASK